MQLLLWYPFASHIDVQDCDVRKEFHFFRHIFWDCAVIRCTNNKVKNMKGKKQKLKGLYQIVRSFKKCTFGFFIKM